jgi:tetratricopeptide (TPR) repeat protein
MTHRKVNLVAVFAAIVLLSPSGSRANDVVADPAASVKKLRAAGDVLAGQKHWPQALASFKQWVAAEPDSGLALAKLGYVESHLHMPSAVADFKRAVELSPADPDVWGLWAQARNDDNDIKGVIECRTWELAHLPQTEKMTQARAQCLLSRADAYLRLHQKELAYKDLEEATKVWPKLANSSVLFRWRGNMFNACGHPAEAEKDFDAAVKVNPKDPDPWVSRSFFYCDPARYDKALYNINQAIALRPHDPGMLVHRANILLLSGDHAGCVVAYKQALDSQPSNLEFRIRYLKSKFDYFNQGDVEELKKLLAKAIKDSPKQPEYSYWHADILQRQHDFRGAAADIARGFEADNKSTTEFGGHLQAFVKNHQTDLALQTVSNEIKLHPQISGLYGFRAEINDKCRRFDDARRDIQTALKIDPRNASVLELRADMKRDLLDYDGAVTDYTECLSIDPGNVLTRLARAGVYKETNRPREACADYLYLKEHNAHVNGDLDVNLADCQSALHNYAAAEQLYKESIKDSNPSIRGRALFELAKMYEKQKRYKEAIDIFLQINKENPNTAMFERCARCYMGLRDWSKAVENMSLAIKGEPRDAGFYSTRGEAYMELRDYKHAIADYTTAIKFGKEQTPKYMRMRADAYDKSGQKDLADKDRQDASSIVREFMN